MTDTPRFEASAVRAYYDRQTAGFVALGQGGSEGAIHRAVWGPGVTSRQQAFHFVEDRIADLVTHRDAAFEQPSQGKAGAVHVVDLGCGVGGSLTYLASRLPIVGTGVTLSPVQVRLATERVRALGLSQRISCLEGDYTRLPDVVATADLAYAIESFVHGPSAAAFFAESARLVRPGGILVICDDVARAGRPVRGDRAVARYRRGWHVNTLITREAMASHAHEAGFTLEVATDLTPWLEFGRPRDRAIATFVALFGWLPLERLRIDHIVGGSALQTCLSSGWIAYELLQFRRR